MTVRAYMDGHPVVWHESDQQWLREDTGERVTGPMPCAHCERLPVDVSVIIPADLSHTGQVRRALKPIDACIADLVERLNCEGSVPVTRAACCGHGRGEGEIILADGRRLRIKDAP